MEKVVQVAEKPLLKPIIPKPSVKKDIIIKSFLAFLITAVGVLTGWLLSGAKGGLSQPITNGLTKVTGNGSSFNLEAGIADEETFSDTAEGTLEKGGIDGEGTHHLDRGMGSEKDVYLTSTTINLDNFVDKKVKIWGQTIAAQQAGWLMDVGRIKVIN